jgi:hypothetical protein
MVKVARERLKGRLMAQLPAFNMDTPLAHDKRSVYLTRQQAGSAPD